MNGVRKNFKQEFYNNILMIVNLEMLHVNIVKKNLLLNKWLNIINLIVLHKVYININKMHKNIKNFMLKLYQKIIKKINK